LKSASTPAATTGEITTTATADKVEPRPTPLVAESGEPGDREPQAAIVAAGAETKPQTEAGASPQDAGGLAAPRYTDAPLMLGNIASSTVALQPPPPVPAAEGLPPPLPVEAVPGPATATAILEPIEDPFGPNPLQEDVVDRAQRALQANEFAYLHLQEEDDIVERYNNSVGISIAPYSLFHIDGALPGNVFRVRFSSVYGYDRPDRSEYFWKAIDGRGPAAAATDVPRAETGLNYQQFYVYNETSTGMASAFTEYPLYLLDPEQNANTAGPGDLTVGLKAVLIKDENWTVTSVTKTYTPVGTPKRGLGRGHLALEQGVAVQLRAGRKTYLHSDLRFHYPIAADPDHGGEVLIGGIGFSRILWTDPIAPPIGRSRALILTAETVITSFLDGLVTVPTQPVIAAPGAKGAFFTPKLAEADMTSFIQNVGLRAIWTKRFSTGTSIGFPLSSAHTHDFSFLIEAQWVH
jgi:hypothetical protein